ncbi:uncharacterized protein LOC135219082 [Macrobrachium nipponense]|uniref:uncharacterized protein LOC135219082 n=1 Tax=Macrobrachium nipponense TaxID=159736 RepID=UPI0030C8880A
MVQQNIRKIQDKHNHTILTIKLKQTDLHSILPTGPIGTPTTKPQEKALADKAVKGNLFAWAKGYTQNRQARVTFQGASSTLLSLENGTPQGGILSPFLFNVLMEKLATTTLPNGVEIFIYADDVCLVSTDRHRSHQNMQSAIIQIENKCKDLGLKINTAKTKAMAIKHSLDPNEIPAHG